MPRPKSQKPSRLRRTLRRSSGYLTLITIVILVTTIASTVHPGRGTAMSFHLPISIVGNASFSRSNGVTGGNGSAANPYIIEGWEITAPVNQDGIDIEQTNASLIIRNVNVQGQIQSSGLNGIFLSQATNVVIDDSTISGLVNGITSLLSNATIENSQIYSNQQYGINIIDGNNVSLLNNTINLNTGDGIHGTNFCINCLLNVTGNTITSNLSGITLQSLNNTIVSENKITNNRQHGIGAYRSTNVLIDLNNITSNSVGVDFGASTKSLVHHNNFRYNSIQALDNETGKNMWDVGYASGGNYWSDYTGVDNCNGPAQNVCTKPDGIGDTPYNFASSQDRYPLMQPFAQTIIHDVAVSSITPSTLLVNQSQIVTITVLVKNEGAVTENFTLTLFYDSTLIGSQTIQTLAPSTSQRILFNWNTTGVPAGTHNLKATASTVWGEIDVADNTLETGPVEIKTPASTTPTQPSLPPTNQQSAPPYLVGVIVTLFIITLFAVTIRRGRHKTHRSVR